LIDSNESNGECDRAPGLTVSRDHDARTIVFNYNAATHDPTDVVKMKQANPASWITEEFLARKASNPELSDSEVLQLHGCVWAEPILAWIPAGNWEACRVSAAQAVIPEGASVCVGVDVGLTHDSSAISVAHYCDDGRIILNATVWSALPNVIAHVTVPGGRMDLSLLEDHVRYLGQRYTVEELAYDPRFFERSAQELEEEFVTVAMQQNASPMADAYQSFYQAVMEGRIMHNGDGVLSAHLAATAAQKTDRGWKISKIRSSQRIDAVPASAVAVYRAEITAAVDGGGVVYG
jgi:phage terminase large subunit-like protein